MKEKQVFPDQLLISYLNKAYDLDIIRLIFLPLGADMASSLYKAEARNQKSYFVKLKKGCHLSIGNVVAEFLHHAGIEQIIPPIKTVQNQLNQSVKDFTISLFPFIEGQDGFNSNLKHSQWITLGKALRQIHEMDIPPIIQSKIRREIYSSKWREIVRSLYSQLQTEPTGDKTTLKLWNFINKNIETIHRLVDNSETLSQEIQDRPSRFVLCHSDIHGGNVLVGGNETLYIVDWDDPIMAPKERDLMFIGGGVGNVWNKPLEEELFYQGYGKTTLDRLILAYYRQERIVEDIALFGQKLLLDTDGGEDRQELYKQFIGMFDPLGVVEIAFRTLDQK
jgi:spectinomycin phosphotransferase